ncbi:MAG: hypothetical protein KatS3mg064_1679 [Tepidiforma sp.]|nr:CAP domain-containing protein [Tepidiforma sp.]GIW18522.1 MAG: hypothetical protein KatS3mg064_1679 [Tepidiforma sp.]
MAGFELARPRAVGVRVREWRPGRFAPLYAAALLAGAGLGIGFNVIAGDAGRTATRPMEAAAAWSPADGVLAPPVVFEMPAAAAVEPAPGSASDPGPGALPLEFDLAMGRFGAWAPAAEAPQDTAGGAASAPAAPSAPPAPARPAPQAAPAQPPAQAAAPAAPAAPAKPNFYVPAVPAGPATALELQLFELINAEREKAGLAPYVLDAGLTKVARTRSQQLIDQGYFGHVDPYGYSMYVELLAYFGYRSYAWAGENLAMNNYPAEQAAAVALDGLMNSPTHRANLLAGDFSRIGIGEITDAQGRHYFTMIFLG